MMAWKQRELLRSSDRGGVGGHLEMVPGGNLVLGGIGALAVCVIANQATAHIAQLVALGET